MSRFNTHAAKPAVHSPIATSATSTMSTLQGGAGYTRSDARSELFLLAVTNMVGKDTFYERAGARDERFENLVRQVAVEDPHWIARFVPWLRGEANMRTASLVAAAEAVHARLTSHRVKNVYPKDADPQIARVNRRLIDAACQRADEPGELLAYWTSHFGKAIPKPVKRGLADAMLRMGTEFNYVKWDSEGHGYRFADLLNLTHPGDRKGSAQNIRGPWQHDLFGYIVKRPHQADLAIPQSLATLTRRQVLLALPVDERRAVLESPELLKQAGMTWEALAGWLQGPMDSQAWEAVIPLMGVFALVRNLRNFDEAGVSDQAAERVAATIADPAQVARSRMLPFRFYAAHKATGSLRWGHALEKALRASLANIPALPGRTLVLIDQSPSMFPGFPFSTRNDGDIALAEKAALFGAAVALRAHSADLVGYGQHSYPVRFNKGDAVLEVMKRFRMDDGTDTPRAMVEHFRGHDRVLIVTDEQTAHSVSGRTVDNAVPANVPVYTWNLAGYKPGHAPSGSRNRHTFAGLTDHAFRMIPMLEAGRSADWDALFGPRA